MNLNCIECYRHVLEVGRLCNGKCMYCRLPTLIGKEAALKNRKQQLEEKGTDRQKRVFNEFVRYQEENQGLILTNEIAGVKNGQKTGRQNAVQ